MIENTVRIMAEAAQAQLDSAKETLKSDSKAGIAALRNVIGIEGDGSDLIQVKEQAITALTNALADDHDAQGLKQLLQDLRPMYALMAKAKAARIVRTVIDALARVPDTAQLQVSSPAPTAPLATVFLCKLACNANYCGAFIVC